MRRYSLFLPGPVESFSHGSASLGSAHRRVSGRGWKVRKRGHSVENHMKLKLKQERAYYLLKGEGNEMQTDYASTFFIWPVGSICEHLKTTPQYLVLIMEGVKRNYN